MSQENEVTLVEMLAARENRVARQQTFLTSGKSLICFTMNIAGAYKNSQIIEKAFNEGSSRIFKLLKCRNIPVIKSEKYSEKTGCEEYILTDSDPVILKRALVEIEDGFPLGRLYDIDVIKSNGSKISRSEIGMPARGCIICKKEGLGCARSRAHSALELCEASVQIICDFFNNQFSRKIAATAVRSLLYEVSITPKPGLVDRLDNGAHTDMTFFTFIDSSVALSGYFLNCVKIAILNSQLPPDEILKKLRYSGMLAEEQMYEATMGVNTHKGAIFSLGIICAAAGYLYANDMEIHLKSLLDISSRLAQGSLNDFENIKEAKTFGEKLFLTKNLKGIRGEAANGYPNVRNIAYPALLKSLNEGMSYDEAGGYTILALLANLEDTNIIKRSSTHKLFEVQHKAKEILKLPKREAVHKLLELNKDFIQDNLSPGGCADLLCVSFMIYFICNGE